jgi:hypothetical protein
LKSGPAELSRKRYDASVVVGLHFSIVACFFYRKGNNQDYGSGMKFPKPFLLDLL